MLVLKLLNPSLRSFDTALWLKKILVEELIIAQMCPFEVGLTIMRNNERNKTPFICMDMYARICVNTYVYMCVYPYTHICISVKFANPQGG